MMKDLKTIIINEKEYTLKRPDKKCINEAQIVYSKAWMDAIKAGSLVRTKLEEYLAENGIWTAQKESQYQSALKKIEDKTAQLVGGKMSLKNGRKLSLEIKRLRLELRDLLVERTSYDSLSAESIAENVRFDFLVSQCIYEGDRPLFSSLDDYNARCEEDWISNLVSEFASVMYELNDDYESSLPENKFLTKFKFVDDKGRLVNKDGHLISVDENNIERLIDENGRYVAYTENGESYFVNKDGERVLTVEDAEFFDDEDNPTS